MILILRRLLRVAALLLVFFVGAVSAQTFQYDILIDVDNNTSSGCAVSPPFLPAVPGIEVRLSATVDQPTLEIIDLTQEDCVGAGFGPAGSIGGGYPVALNAGLDGGDAVELGTLLSDVTGANTELRLYCLAESATGNDIIETTRPLSGQPIIFVIDQFAIPTLSLLGLLTLTALLVLLAGRKLLGRGIQGVAFLSVLMAGGVWATLAPDGDFSEWAGVPVLGIDDQADSTSGEAAIEAFDCSATSDGVTLFFYINVEDLENTPPTAVDDSYTAVAMSASSPTTFSGNNILTDLGDITVTDPNLGVLSNDLDAQDPPSALTVVAFDSPSANGGTVNVNADGTFSYMAPAGGPVPDTFAYTVEDTGGLQDVGTVTITPDLVILTDQSVPITVTHVQAGAAGSNSGTFADPFTALPATQATDIVYVHADGVYNAQSYTLGPGQRFLGEGDGNSHLVTTDQAGAITLPPGNGGTNRPSITNTVGSSVTPADDSETSNFSISGATVAAFSAPGGITTVVDFNRSVISGGGRGVALASGAGQFTFTDVDITDPIITGVLLDGGTLTATFDSTSAVNQNSNAAALTVQGGHSGTATFNNPITATNGTGLQFDNADGTYEFNAQVTLNGGDAGIDILNDSSGTFTFANTDITGPSGAAFNVDGGAGTATAAVTFNASSSITHASNTPAVTITDHGTGAIVHGGTLGVTGGTGLQFDNADGTYSFSGGTVTLNGGDAGIDILNGSSGSFTFASPAITSPTGTAFNVNNSPAVVSLGGSVVQANNAAAVSVTGHAAGTMTVTATISAANGAGLQFTNADGAYNFNAQVTLNGGDAGIDILNGSAGSFTFVNTDVTSPTGTAINIENSTASATFQDMCTIVQANNATTLNVNNHSAGTIEFQTSSSINATNGNGYQFNNADGTYNMTGTNTLAGGDAGIDILGGSAGSFSFFDAAITSPSGVAFNVVSSTATSGFFGSITQANNAAAVSVSDHSVGTLSFNNGTISATNGTGLQFSNADGTYTFADSNTTTLNGSDAGIDIFAGSSGTFTFASAASSITSPFGTAFNHDSSAGTVSYFGTITQANPASAVNVSGATGGTRTFGGLIDADTTAATAVNVAGAGTTNFTGVLDIDATSGTGFSASGGGIVSVTGTSSTVNTTTGTPVTIIGTTIAAGNVSFQSISSMAGGAILVDNTGTTGQFRVLGTGGAGTGGTMAGATTPIVIGGSGDTRFDLSDMTLNTFTVDGVALLSSGNDSTSGTIDNFTITSAALGTSGLRILGDGGALGNHSFTLTTTISNSTISVDGEAIDIDGQDSTNAAASVDVNVTGSSLTSAGDDGLEADANDVVSVCVNATGNTLSATLNDIDLDNGAGGSSLGISQASTAAMAAANGAAAVAAAGTITFNDTCATP